MHTSNGLDSPGKRRLRPFLGYGHVDSQQLHSYVRGKVPRWRQEGLNTEELSSATGNQLALWYRSGYPVAIIKKCWTKRIGNDGVAYIARRLIKREAADHLHGTAGLACSTGRGMLFSSVHTWRRQMDSDVETKLLRQSKRELYKNLRGTAHLWSCKRCCKGTRHTLMNKLLHFSS